MHWRVCSQSVAAHGICLMVIVAAGALAGPAHAQQQLNVGSAVDQSYPQWARPYLFSGLNAGSSFANGSNQQAYTTRLGSGIVGLSVNSYSRDDGAGAAGNYLAPSPVSAMAQRQDWFGSSFASPAWRTSVAGTYKTDQNSPFYTTASFGVAGYKPNLSGLSGLTGFTAGNEATGLTASAGVGVQVTPNITIEGGFTFTQGPPSAFR
jgi:opacity protein-like surface antigen